MGDENKNLPNRRKRCSLKSGDEATISKLMSSSRTSLLKPNAPQHRYSYNAEENENFCKLSEMFMRKVRKQNENPMSTKLDDIVQIIFDLSYAEPRESRAYARLCLELGAFNMFKKTVMQKAQAELLSILRGNAINNEQNRALVDEVKALREQFAAAGAPVTMINLVIPLDRAEKRLLDRAIRIVGFVGELCDVGLLSTKLLMTFLADLVTGASNDFLRLACVLLTDFGEMLEIKGESAKNGMDLSAIFARLQAISEGAEPAVASHMLRIIQEVVALRKNNWISWALRVYRS